MKQLKIIRDSSTATKASLRNNIIIATIDDDYAYVLNKVGNKFEFVNPASGVPLTVSRSPRSTKAPTIAKAVEGIEELYAHNIKIFVLDFKS